MNNIDILIKKGKKEAATYLHSECCRPAPPENLHKLLDNLLDPCRTDIDNWETIEWCRWLMAGGRTPDEFIATVQRYDNATTCGLVWTANFVAYRCRTCGISPCMSLCAECFQRGNHNGHDFNMFKSQAGGACDCGDTNVMKESGFCFLHGPHAQNSDGHSHDTIAPPDLLCVANEMMPRLILRLIQHMREHSVSLNGFLGAVQSADRFITMLHEMSSMGAAMRQVMSNALTNPQIYKNLTELKEDIMSPEYYEYMKKAKETYEEALTSLPNPEPPEEYKDIPSLQKNLVHKSFLEEFVFWTAKFEFPQKIVCLLLNLLPDADYKEAFTRAFVLHYSRISQLLSCCQDPDMLSNRVVHVSVQLFSNEKLAFRMAEQMGLLHVMVISLKSMMSQITTPSTLHDKTKNVHRVVDCGHQVMKNHCYWPLVSDLNNILSHRPIALKFLEDDGLLKMWFSFLTLFQGMNVNHREMNQHIEFEPSTYYAAFSAELEASASPLWALVSHLKDESTAHLTKNLLRHCRNQLNEWLEHVNFENTQNEGLQVSFHLPLHRYFAVFLYQAVRNQKLSLAELLPPPQELKALILHPLRVQVAFYEIISGLWARNGLQIRGQAMTYIQCHFCNSMVDADIFLLQVAKMNLPHGEFLTTVFEKFNLLESFSISSTVTNSYLEPDHEIQMMENCLIFLSSLASIRTAIGISDEDLVSLEMSTLLCMGDKTHSQLMELMPERCGNTSQSRDFEAVLSRVAVFRAPNFEVSGNMLQGMYVPKSFVWEDIYDPIYVLLRSVHRKDFQTSLDRFTDFVRHSGKGSGTLWPPFKIPEKAADPYTDPRNMLLSKVLQGVLFVIFYKAVHTTQISDQLVALSIYLLEMALGISETIGSKVVTTHEVSYGRFDMDFSTWFATDCLLANLRTEIDSVFVKPNANSSSELSDDLSVDEMEVEYYEGEMDMYSSYDSNNSITPIGPNFSISEQLAIMPSGAVSVSGEEAIVEVGTRTLRDENLRQRALQVVLAPVKPVASVQKKEMVGRTHSLSENQPSIEVVVNESIISLLLKLHSKFSSLPDSYTPFYEAAEAKKIILDALNGVNNGLEIIYNNESSMDGSSSSSSFKNNSNYEFSHKKLYEILHPKNSSLNSRIGDGVFFLRKILDKIGASDESCRECILETKEKIWPKKAAEKEEEIRAREERELEEKKARALERQRRLMAETAARQKAFMKHVMSNEEFYLGENEPGAGGSSSSGGGMGGNYLDSDLGLDGDLEDGICPELTMKPIEYDCVHCHQTSPSTHDNPIGLVILLQSSSTLGHRTKLGTKGLSLPDINSKDFKLNTMKAHNERRLEEYMKNFDDSSWLLSISAGWEGGIYVQTCGHYLHMECLKGYQTVLKSQQRHASISCDRGEYLCPLCRQLANSFLPLSPEFGIRQSALVKDRKTGEGLLTPEATVPEIPPSPESNVALEVVKLLREYPFPTVPCKLMDAMSKTMEEMTNATIPKFRQVGSSKNTKSISLFVNSIARTNLELELVQRGGSLVTRPIDPVPSTSSAAAGSSSSSSISKRSPLVPLMHVLGVHYKILSTDLCSPKIWERILGIRFLPDSALSPIDREVPMLLRDPNTILLHLLMQLPMHVDLAYFTSIVQGIFNLVYIQIMCSITCKLSEKEREEWKARTTLHVSEEINQLFFLLGTVIRYLEKSPLYLPDSYFGDMDNNNSTSTSFLTQTQTNTSNWPRPKGQNFTEEELEMEVQQLLLPYLRIASLIQHHIYEQEFPNIISSDYEFGHLASFLGLGSSQNMSPELDLQNPESVKAHSFLHWISPTPLTAIWTLCEDLSNFIRRAQVSARFLLETQHTLWNLPTLLELPHNYDAIFQLYHRKQCLNCKLVPKEANICLVCGTMVCMKEACCKNINTGVLETIQHSIDCGAGTSMFLTVNSSTIVVVRGRRACLWGSVYMDLYGEEDRDLKRGKPLFLSKDRYNLLHQQWINHRFDHTSKKWVWHRDNL